MKKMIVQCNGATPEEIVNLAKAFYAKLGYETQSAITENGDLCMQARKSTWLRNATGTAYALQMVVSQTAPDTFELSAGWGKWADKVIVGLIATFVAFGVLIIPTCIGIHNQAKLPKACLDHVADLLKAAHPGCAAYHVA